MTQLIVALNTSELKTALEWTKAVMPRTNFVKIGLPLYLKHGQKAVDELISLGARVFLDLKLCDIPSVVEQAVKTVANTGAHMLTLHGWGGPEMLSAGVQAAAGTELRIVVVSVLTSVGSRDMDQLGLDTARAVNTFARWAQEAGAWGLVCSGHELPDIKQAFPALKAVVPGIRAREDAKGDQQRVVSPQDIAGLAEYAVIGRPITHSDDPAEAAASYLKALGNPG